MSGRVSSQAPWAAPIEPAEERELLSRCGLTGPARWELMKGDGSERRFYRLRCAGRSYVAIVAQEGGRAESESYLYLAAHLLAAGVPVPEVYGALPEGRCVVVEDLGDTHLEDLALRLAPDAREAAYRGVLELLGRMQERAAAGLDPGRLYQGARYDRLVMLERESRYFLERFVGGYLGLTLPWEEAEADFQALADAASRPGSGFFLHRDFQSRNVMVRAGGRFVFIDFQAGRFGPRAYDVASLLIDPYVGLPEGARERLLAHYEACTGQDPADFRPGWVALALQRNLQILGAFSFLGLVRGKRAFLRHIPAAVGSLRLLLADIEAPDLPVVRRLVGYFSNGQ